MRAFVSGGCSRMGGSIASDGRYDGLPAVNREKSIGNQSLAGQGWLGSTSNLYEVRPQPGKFIWKNQL